MSAKCVLALCLVLIFCHLELSQNGDQIPKFVVFQTVSTIKDEMSAAKFHYIKTVSSLLSGINILIPLSIYWQGVAPSLDI